MGGRSQLERAQGYILLVEDDRDIQETLVSLLADFGYTVRTASNGKEALAVLASEPPPRLILLDQMMPVMNGEQFIDHLSNDPSLPSLALVPICVLTAAETFRREQDVVAVLRKPFDEAALMGIVERYCR
jgi:CheY-like chemotaxis protein